MEIVEDSHEKVNKEEENWNVCETSGGVMEPVPVPGLLAPRIEIPFGISKKVDF